MADLTLLTGNASPPAPAAEPLPLGAQGARAPAPVLAPEPAPTPETTVEARLNYSQARARVFGSPAKAKALHAKSVEAGVPYNSAVVDPRPVEEGVYDPMWSQHARNKPVADALLDPVNSIVYTPDEVKGLAQAAGVDKEPLSRTYPGQVDEASKLSLAQGDLSFRQMMNGGVMSPEDEAESTRIKWRLDQLPQARGMGGQILEGVIGQGRVMGRMTLGAGAGALAAAPFGAAPLGAVVGGAAVGVHMAMGQSYGELRDIGVPHNVAQPLAFIAGAAIGGLDALSFGVSSPIAKVISKSPALTKLTKETVGPAIKSAMKDARFLRIMAEFGKSAAAEVPAEIAQELVQIVADHVGVAMSPAGGDYKPPTLEEAKGRMLMAGAVAAFAAPAFSSFGIVAREMTAKVNTGEQSQTVINNIYNAAEKLAEVPAPIKEKFGKDAAKEGPVKYVTVPVADLDTLLQKAESNPALTEWLARPETERQLAQARSSGARVSIPYGEFVAHVVPLDTARTLAQTIGLNDDMSPKEAKALKPAVEKARKEMQDISKRKALIDEGPEGLVAQDVEKKLLAVGATKEAARAQATLVASGLATLANKLGRDPWEVYRDSPLDITKHGFERGATALKYVTERLLASTKETKTREHFYDANTNLPNENALALAPKANFYYFADPEGVAYLNDKGGGHPHADRLFRSHARNLLKIDPTVHKAFGGFVGTANTEAEARAIVEKANAAAEAKGFTMDYRVAATAEDAVKQMREWKAGLEAAEKAEGFDPKTRTRAGRGERPFGADPDIAPDKVALAEDKPVVTTNPALLAAQAAMTPAQAHAVYVNPKTRVLTNRGWAVTRAEHRKKFVFSGDAAGIGVLDRKYGKAVADKVVAHIEKVISQISGDMLDAAHPHGDEIMAQFDTEKELQEFGDKLSAMLDKAVINVYDPDKKKAYTINGIAFGFGIAADEKVAEARLNAHKEKLAVAKKRDRKGFSDIIDARVVERPVNESDLSGDQRGDDLGAGDVRGGGAAADPAGAGLADQVVPGFSDLYRQLDTLGQDVRGSITFDRVKRNWFKTTFTGRSDLSTFLHESAHYLLELQRKYSDNPKIAADLQTLEEWVGVKPGEDWSVDALETFALGMEKYFEEGRAPSAKLASAFALFKTWILHVYRRMLNLNVPLTDEVRSVMDRMLATDAEIGARQLELGYFPNEMVLTEGGMSDIEQQQYRDLYTKGAQQAQAEVDREVILAMRKEKTAEYQRIAADVDKQIDSHPVIALRAWLAGENRTDGGLIPDLNGTKFDANLIPERYKNRLAEFTAPAGGIDPDELAPFFGFKNKTEMFDEMFSTPARSTMKAQMVKAEMTARYPAYGPDPTWVEQVALEQLHESDSISNALEVELRTIYRKASLLPPQSPALVAKYAAMGEVSQMSRKEMRPAQWRNAEIAALREQHKALAAKDFPAAADATRKRLYSRAMWQEIQKATSKIDKAEQQVKRYADPATLARLGKSSDTKLDTGQRLGSVIRDSAKVLVEGVGLAEKSPLSRQTTFDAQVSLLETAGLPISIDPVLRERPLSAWEDLTYMEAMSVRDALKNLSAVSKGLNEIRVGQNIIQLNDIADEVVASMEKSGLLNREGQKGEKHSRLRKLRSDIAKPETVAIDIDGGEIGAFHRAFIQTAETGQYENERRKKMRRDDIRKLGKEFAPDDWGKQVAKEHVFAADGRTYTGGEVFAMLLNFGTPKNRTKLIEGMKKAGRAWTEENVLAFIHQVFPDQKPYKLAQAILDYISRPDLWEDSSKVHEEISGVRPEKEPAVAIPTPDGGSITGGYYHLIYDNKVPLKDAEASSADALNAMHDANPLNRYAANGSNKARTGYVAPLLLNPTAWTAHLYEVDHFTSNAQGIIDRHKLLQHPRIKGAIINGLGIEYWTALKESNNFIAADGRKITAELLQASTILDKLIYHNAILTMGGNLLSGVNQVVTGLPATLAYLGPRGVPGFAKALLEFAKSPFAMWEAVAKESGELAGMSFHYDRDLRLVADSEIAGHRWEDFRSRFAAATMSPVVFGQKLVNVITYKAAKGIALAEGKSGVEAIAFANSAVRQSQSASAPKDFTAVQRSPDGMMRVLTSLASYQFTLNDMVMPRQMTKAQMKSHLSRLVMLIMVSTMMKALFAAILPKLEEKEAEDRRGLEKLAADSEIPGLLALTESTMDVLGNIPLAGRTTQSLLSGRTPRYASWVDTMFKSVEAGSKLLSDKGMSKKDVKAVVEAVGLASGIPTRHVFFAPGEFGWELLNGNIDDNPWAFFQEITLVRPGKKGD